MAKQAEAKKAAPAATVKLDSPAALLAAAKAAAASVVKKHGEGAIIVATDKPKINLPAISTGSLAIDMATGIGGVPRGRVIEIYGPESSGKTTLSTKIMAEAQKQGLVVAMIDAEHAFDSSYAQQLGVDMESLMISQPDNGEQALDILLELVKSGAFGCIVVDSVAALVPKSEIEGEMGDQSMGVQARMMSKVMRMVMSAANKTGTTVIFINQIRLKIGVMFGNPETTSGGNALKFGASIRMEIRRQKPIQVDGEAIGQFISVKMVKNKVAPPFKKVEELPLIFGKGFDRVAEIYEVAKEMGAIVVAGAHHYMPDASAKGGKGEKLASNRDEMIAVLNKNQQLFVSIEKQVLEHLNGVATSAVVPKDDSIFEEIDANADELDNE